MNIHCAYAHYIKSVNTEELIPFCFSGQAIPIKKYDVVSICRFDNLTMCQYSWQQCRVYDMPMSQETTSMYIIITLAHV